MVTPFPGAIPTKPGSATVPFFGIAPAILDAQDGKRLDQGGEPGEGGPEGLQNIEGVLAIEKPWPSIARTIWKDHKRYLETYMHPYPGYFYTGDGAAKDKDGYIWIKGRVDGERYLRLFSSLRLSVFHSLDYFIRRCDQRFWSSSLDC